MKLLFLVLSSFFISQNTFAQQYFGSIPEIVRNDKSTDGKTMMCGHSSLLRSSATVIRPNQSMVDRRPYDVLSYNLYMDWRNPLSTVETTGLNRQFNGINDIFLRIDSANTSTITLNAETLRIDSVFIHGNKSLVFNQPFNSELSISLPRPLQVNDTATIRIYYTYTGKDDIGFYLYPQGLKRGNDSVEERIAYTMSEPQDARFWMPCNDTPYDKAKASIRVRVPYVNSKSAIQYTVSSNGTRTIGTPQEDVKGTLYRDFLWQDTTPIPTYLMVASASKYKEYTQWYKRVSNPNDSVEIINYSWPNDDGNDSIINGSKNNTRHTFRNVPSMMATFSKLYGEYPFVKYGHTAVSPFRFGGMEHQSMTTVHRNWLNGNNESGVAHELMHQWTGDQTTCASMDW